MRSGIHAAVGIGLIVASSAFASDIQVTSTDFVVDREFPILMQSVWDGWDLKIGMGPEKDYADLIPPGATLRVFIRNQSSQPIEIDRVLLDDIDLSDQLQPRHRKHSGLRAAAYQLNDTTTTPPEIVQRLDRLGQPIWFQVRPNPIAAGDFAELTLRLRSLPEKKTLKVVAVDEQGDSARAVVRTDDRSAISIASFSFSEQIDRLFLSIRDRKGEEFQVCSVRLDGKEVVLESNQPRSSQFGFLPIEIPLQPGWKYGSFHHVAVTTIKNQTAAAMVRARDDFFALGMWGYRNYGNTTAERTRDTCTAFRDHLFNTHMGMGGGQTGYLSRSDGLQLLEEMGLRYMDRDPTKATVKSPFIYSRFLLDEPDAHDHAVDRLPGNLRVGGLAQGLVERQKHWTEIDPRSLCLLNVDLTFKPQNWLTYGPLPDILAVDPYYQGRLNDAYWKHPGWLAQFCHPYYVYAISEIARFGCEPQPLHIILNSVSMRDGDRVFRYGTPEEKRIEFYYALAAGAKGISYWWFTPYGNCRGCGAEEPEAKAMMAEMAHLNAEARALFPLLANSHPAAVSGTRLDPFTTTLPYWLMARTLFVGTDTALIVLVNRDHCSDRVGTLYEPIPRGIITFRTPHWMKPVDVFRLSRGEVQKVEEEDLKENEKDCLVFHLKDIQLTDILILTEDPSLRERIYNRLDEFEDQLKKLDQQN